jgi:WD40 repeat protein
MESTPATRKQSRFRAFISYSHAADGRLAPEIQRALQRFARPWYRSSALRVFRDRTDLGANPDLWSSVEEALLDSEHFLLFASMEAAGSKWVRREIETWLRVRGDRSIIIVVTGGELAWSEAAGDFDWGATTALPASLRGRFRKEPLWVDLRWARTEEELSLNHARFRDAVADIAAPLHHVPRAELESEEVRQRRRTRRLVAVVAVALFFLAAAATYAAVLAGRNARRAQEQARISESRRRTATARLLAAEARSALENRAARIALGTRALHATLLGVESVRMEATPQGIEVLAEALALLPKAGRSFPASDGSFIALARGGKVVAATVDGRIVVWDVKTGEIFAEVPGFDQVIALSDDGGFLACATPDGRSVVVLRLPSREVSARVPVRLPPLSVAVSPEGRRLAVADRSNRIALFDVGSARAPRMLPAGNRPQETVAFSTDGRTLAALSVDGIVKTWNADSGREVSPPANVAQVQDEETDRMLGAVSGDGRVATGDATGTVQVWDTQTLREVVRIEHGDRWIQAIALSADGGSVAAVSRTGTLRVWSIDSGPFRTLMRGPPAWRADATHSVAISGDGRRRALSSSEAVDVVDVDGGGAPARARVADPSAMALDGDGGRFAVADGYEAVELVDLATGRALARVQTPAENFGGLIAALALSGDARRVAVGGAFETLRVFDLATGGILLRGLEAQDRPVRAEDALSFALDGEGRRIALASRSELAIAPLIGSGTRLTRATSARVLNLAFSPNGRLLATDDADHMLRVWDAASLEEKARIGHGFRIRALAFGAGGTRLRLATEDGAVREVPWLGSDLANVACSTVTRNLAPTEWRTYLPDEPPRETCALADPDRPSVPPSAR